MGNLSQLLSDSADALRHRELADRAIMYIQKRNSLAKGNLSFGKEWTEARQRVLDEDPSTVLMNEVLRLRAIIHKEGLGG